MILEKGYIQVYTGEGKGKTTAAFGIALRMVGAGGTVFVGQFLKGRPSGEIDAAQTFPRFTVEQFGAPTFVPPTAARRRDDIDKVLAGFARAREALTSGTYDLIILDEINVAVDLGLIDIDPVLELLAEKPEHTELILTGRISNADIASRMIAAADLVTEMKPIKHYYDSGTAARRGIED
jgi:cob(I)alamin adenosyltransferase